MDNLSKLAKLAAVLALMVIAVAPVVALGEGRVAVVDALQRNVELASTPSRVVVLAPSITELLATLGLEGAIVGADSFSLGDWYMDVGNRLKERGVVDVGGYWWSVVSVERILELRPDLVLADRGAHRPLLETLEAYNLTVVYLNGGSAKSVNDIYSDAYTLGLLFNKPEEVERLVNNLEESLAMGRRLLKDYEGKRVLIVIDFWQGIWVVGKATFIDDVLTRLGLVNAATVVGWNPVSIEVIARWNPDIVLVACPYATQELIEQSGLTGLNKPVVLLNETEVDIVSRPGPLLKYAPEVLYRALTRGLATTKPTTTEKPSQQEWQPYLAYALVPVVAAVSGVLGYYAGARRGTKR